MADDDNFDIDIYGDDASPDFTNEPTGAEAKQEDHATDMQTDAHNEDYGATNGTIKAEPGQQRQEGHSDIPNGNTQQENGMQQIASTSGSVGQPQPPKQAPVQQGMKRKQGADDERPLDAGATSALLISDLHWWITEEDVRGWANQSECEDELVDVTFSEHKVNGKSKGSVYVLMQSPQAATALKHQLESYYKDSQHGKKPNVVFNPAHINPYKTLPKDVPARDKGRDNRPTSGSYSGGPSGSQGNYNRGGGYRNFNRGGGNQMGYQNRNYSGPAGNVGMGGYGGAPNPMGGFGGGPMGGMNQFGNFNARGGMMGGGMRGGNMGGRGGRGGNMMGGMGGMGMTPNMAMGGMGMGMGMGAMTPNMGMMPMGGNPISFPSPASSASRQGVQSSASSASRQGFQSPASSASRQGFQSPASVASRPGYPPSHPLPLRPAFPNHGRGGVHHRRDGGGATGFGGGGPTHFNPAFFGQTQGGGGGDSGNWNPHGAKRPRPE